MSIEDLLKNPHVRKAASEVLMELKPLFQSPSSEPKPARDTQWLVDRLEDAARVSRLDTEVGHLMADRALLEYVDDQTVDEVWSRVKRYYS